MISVNRRSMLVGLATAAVAPALPRFGREYASGGYVPDETRSALGLDVAGPDGAVIVRAIEAIPRWAAVSQVSYRGMIYVERAVK